MTGQPRVLLLNLTIQWLRALGEPVSWRCFWFERTSEEGKGRARDVMKHDDRTSRDLESQVCICSQLVRRDPREILGTYSPAYLHQPHCHFLPRGGNLNVLLRPFNRGKIAVGWRLLPHILIVPFRFDVYTPSGSECCRCSCRYRYSSRGDTSCQRISDGNRQIL
jgi:hypothetical protein